MDLRPIPVAERIPATPTGPTPGESADRAQVTKLAEEFEAMLMLQMLRQMRTSMLDEESGEGEGLGADVFGDTMDQELARHLSQAGGFGLTAIITEAFERSMKGVGGPTSAAAPTGPTEAAGALLPAVAAPPARVGSGTHHAAEGGAGDLIAGAVSSAFGWRADPFHGRSKFHAGIDLKAAYGRPVPAVSRGTVSFAGEQGAYGLTVVVDHGGGLTTRYAHLSSLDVTTGAQVAAGDVVGLVGQTGRATGPHLHFEVRHQGEIVDPRQAGSRFDAAGLKLVPLDVD
jgi:murein DD-endopeptidase MepM/ murein hydrolase activator NlpD